LAACTGEDTREPVQPLVDAGWLNANQESVAVLDIRYGAQEGADRETYEAGHVPGAIYANYTGHPWRAARDSVPGMLPPLDELQSLIGGFGVSRDDHVVIVAGGISAAEMGAATRIFWGFKVLGHERVSILDGGYASWVSGAYPVETGWNEPAPEAYEGVYQAQLVATTEDVVAARERGTPLIDARSEAYYRGEKKSGVAARYGTISGARSVPPQMYTVDEEGVFIDAASAAQVWQAAGLPVKGEQITFCNTGHLASLAWFTAYAILDNREARLYDGSLAEWAADSRLPMETPSTEP
jgi:thiosulfate/3-mercaptopyruvate sulfurtransferase